MHGRHWLCCPCAAQGSTGILVLNPTLNPATPWIPHRLFLLLQIPHAQAQAAFPDLAKAAGACQRVFRILDSRPTTGHTVALPDPSSDPEAATATKRAKASAGVVPQQAAEGRPATPSGAGADVEIEGRVELRRVAFAYPTRPQRLVLKEFNLIVPAGTSCALVRAERWLGCCSPAAWLLMPPSSGHHAASCSHVEHLVCRGTCARIQQRLHGG